MHIQAKLDKQNLINIVKPENDVLSNIWVPCGSSV